MEWTLKFSYDLIISIWYIVFFVFSIIIYILNTKAYKSIYDKTINKDYPEKLKPSELSMLLYKRVIPEVFTASILKLIYYKKINIQKDKDDYIFTLNHNTDYKPNDSQQYMLSIIFDSIGSENKVRLSKLREYSKNKGNSSEFLTNYYVWKRMAQSETFYTFYYEPKTGYQLTVLYRYITWILIFLNFILKYHSLTAYALILPTLFLKLYFYKTYKRTKKANDQYHQWLAFKRYLITMNNDYLELNDEETFDYLIFGTILGVCKKMNNEIFDYMDELTIQLNEIINRCVINAELYARREFKWK